MPWPPTYPPVPPEALAKTGVVRLVVFCATSERMSFSALRSAGLSSAKRGLVVPPL